MNKSTRTENALRNILTGVTGQAVLLLFSFLCRMVFVRCLSEEYLGVSALFTNILSMLSLADLGIGTAIVYELYKPLAERDEDELASLMKVYATAYKIIGTVVAIVGVCLIPFLQFLIAEPPNIKENIYVLYLLFLFNTASSYFFSYKSSILTADQKNYIVLLVNYGITVGQNVLQIVLLLVTRNYLIYLICQIICTLIFNFTISAIAGKEYPFIKRKNVKKLSKEKVKRMVTNIKALVIVKISGVLVNSSDNIIISAIEGLASTGVTSNYTLLSNTLNTLLTQVFSGMSAGIGNVNAVESKEKKRFMFDVVNLLDFWLFGWCAVAFMILSSDIVRICFGNSYVMELRVVYIMAVNFYTVGMQNVVWLYKSTLGLFNYGKYLTLITGGINIILSIILGLKLGVFGILLATFISRLLTNIWYDPLAVFKYGFQDSFSEYIKKYLFFAAVLFGTFGCCYVLSSILPYSYYANLGIKVLICIIIPNVIFYLIFRNTNEFKHLFIMIQKIVKKILNRIRH